MKMPSLGLLLILSVLSGFSLAHESRPIYIDLQEMQPGVWQLQWKIPPSLPYFNLPEVRLPDSCAARRPEPAHINGPDGLILRQLYRCEQGLAGGSLSIRYPGPNPSVSTLVRYQTLKPERHTALLSPEQTAWTIPEAETTSAVAKTYTLLGIKHIWGGLDHLLFVVCLLWIAGTGKRILITITGFTLAHSVTLVLSALNLVRLPIPPVEATIALSIVFLATEIMRDRRDSLTWRYPIAVSVSFGLLHGFGFAAALKEIGLPQTELVAGLLFFNLGVEIGQLVFAVAVISLCTLLARLARLWLNEHRLLQVARFAVSYTVGILATFWMVERCVAFLPV